MPFPRSEAHRPTHLHFPRINTSHLCRLPPVHPHHSISWDHLRIVAIKMRSWYLALSLLLIAASVFQPIEARGGRGRGGGSFGGLLQAHTCHPGPHPRAGTGDTREGGQDTREPGATCAYLSVEPIPCSSTLATAFLNSP